MTYEDFRVSHPVELRINRCRARRYFTNEQVAVLTGIRETGTRDGFKVRDRAGSELSFDDVLRIEDEPPETYWPERWRKGEDL